MRAFFSSGILAFEGLERIPVVFVAHGGALRYVRKLNIGIALVVIVWRMIETARDWRRRKLVYFTLF